MYQDDLTDRMARLAADVEDGTLLASATAVRTRGDRRRTATAAAAIAGVSAVAVTTGVALAGMGGSAPPQSDVGAARGLGGPPTTIPAGLVMLHEGEPRWQRNDDRAVASAVNPCGGADATRVGRTDARTMTGPGLAGEEQHSPSKVTHHLFLYADNAAAAAAFDALATEAASCGWQNSTPSMNPAEDDMLLRLRKIDPGQGGQKDRYWLHDAVVLRDRNALLLLSSDTKGAGMTSNIADQELPTILGPVCRAGIACRDLDPSPGGSRSPSVSPSR